MFEEENSLTKKLVGNSYCPEVYAGSIFSLSGSKVEKHNGEFLTISVKHYINQIPNTTDTPIYYNSFVAIPSNVPFRPAQTHFKNRIFHLFNSFIQHIKTIGFKLFSPWTYGTSGISCIQYVL